MGSPDGYNPHDSQSEGYPSKNDKTPATLVTGVLFERLAATYSRGSYTTTTIGHAAFDSRVRKGNGSGHCGNATKLGARS